MRIESLEHFPNGKTELPATVIVNKMGKSVVLDLRLQIQLPSEKEKKLEYNELEVEINS